MLPAAQRAMRAARHRNVGHTSCSAPPMQLLPSAAATEIPLSSRTRADFFTPHNDAGIRLCRFNALAFPGLRLTSAHKAAQVFVRLVQPLKGVLAAAAAALNIRLPWLHIRNPAHEHRADCVRLIQALEGVPDALKHLTAFGISDIPAAQIAAALASCRVCQPTNLRRFVYASYSRWKAALACGAEHLSGCSARAASR